MEGVEVLDKYFIKVLWRFKLSPDGLKSSCFLVNSVNFRLLILSKHTNFLCLGGGWKKNYEGRISCAHYLIVPYFSNIHDESML